jgi:hypothetical protein
MNRVLFWATRGGVWCGRRRRPGARTPDCAGARVLRAYVCVRYALLNSPAPARHTPNCKTHMKMHPLTHGDAGMNGMI